MLNELALFAGIGGGILGGKLAGRKIVCAVECAEYPRNVLVARQNDGSLEPFPIWDDVRTFDGKPWRGIVDVVSGGFPCQDISVAGRGEGLSGRRSSLWFEMLRIIEEANPKYVFVENSPMLRKRGGIYVVGGLAELGYDAQWGIVSAKNVSGAWLPTPLASDGSQHLARLKVCSERKTKFGAAKSSIPYWLLKNHNARLHPKMSEWVMGFPDGWSDLQPLETRKFRKWQESHGILFHSNPKENKK